MSEVAVKAGDWVLCRVSGGGKINVMIAEAEKVSPRLVKFVGRRWPRQCHRLDVVASFADKALAERVKDAIGGVAGEYGRRQRAAHDECSRRITEALEAANKQVAQIVAAAGESESC